MAPNYKLTYFAIKALAEPIRFLFHYGGIEFEDNRIEFADWPQIKPTMPIGKLPILEVDGKVYTQSAAIARYVAKQVGLTGKDDLEALEIDSVVDTMVDLRLAIVGYYFEPDEGVKQRKKEAALKDTIPLLLENLDNQVKNNGGYFVGGKLTWADLYFAGFHETVNSFLGENILDKYPNLKAVVDKVYAIPSIKAWIEKRPVTDR